MDLEVLIVDEDKVVLFLHQTFVKNNGIATDAVPCTTGKETLDYLKANDKSKHTFLLFLDIHMPVMNGWEILDAINEQNFSAQIFVIIVTSSINTVDQEKAKSYEQVIDFIIKPITTEALSAVKQLDELKQFFE